MTVHMFRVFIGSGPMQVSEVKTRINDWVDSNAKWGADTFGHTLNERTTAIQGGGGIYYTVDVRFTQDATKNNLLQKLTDKLKDKVAWYRVGYHACGHDSIGSDCAWHDSVEWTAKDATIPSGVPAF